jgi:hypothetical protein
VVVARTRQVRTPELRTWLRIIHWHILVAFTIPEVITLVLHPAFRRAAVDRGFRKFPQFDSVAERVGGATPRRRVSPSQSTSSRLLRCLTLTSVAVGSDDTDTTVDALKK